MKEDYVKISKAKNVLLMIADGKDPTSGNFIEKADFLLDPRVKKYFIYAAEILGRRIKEEENDSRKFIMTDEERARVVLPEGKIGVMEFVKCINAHVDLTKSRKLTAISLNKQLIKLGILSEKITDKGNTRTVVNEKSKDYGIETETRIYKKHSHDKILFNDVGKKYLLDNLQVIMGSEE